MDTLYYLIEILTLLITVLISVAFITLVERKVLALLQGRKGPNVVGFVGLGQPFADALKLMGKEVLLIVSANTFLFLYSPIFIFVLSLFTWGLLPMDTEFVIEEITLNVLLIAVTTSLISQHILFSGWSSGSRYALLGALRATAQFLSYEMFISLAILNVTLEIQTLDIADVADNQSLFGPSVSVLYLAFVFFFISTMAEVNRPPFDLPEAEGELVAGYHVEYSALPFAFFYISEYASFLFNAFMTSLVFLVLGQSSIAFPFYLESNLSSFLFCGAIICLFQIGLRASVPRYVIDYIMDIGWKYALSFNLLLIFVMINLIFFINL